MSGWVSPLIFPTPFANTLTDCVNLSDSSEKRSNDLQGTLGCKRPKNGFDTCNSAYHCGYIYPDTLIIAK